MKNFSFSVDCNIERIIDLSERTVDQIKVGEEIIGYVAVNKTGREVIVTPFTSAGEFREAHCIVCAAKELFSVWARIPSGLTGMAAEASSESNITVSVLVGKIKDVFAPPLH